MAAHAKALTASIIAAFAVAAADAAVAQSRGRRSQTMEQCVGAVLGRLARAGAPESQVGPAVVSQCDGPLRARLAAEVAAGRAGGCTVETCLDMARSRAAEEATQAYRSTVRR